MIDHISIQNYRSLRSVEVELKPLTVIVGANDSGKTSFLSAISKLVGGSGDFPEADHRNHDLGNRVSIIAKSGLEEIYSNNQYVDLKMNLNKIVNSEQGLRQIGPAALYQLPVQGVAMTSNGFRESKLPEPLGGDGSGVPSLLDALLRKDRQRFFALVETLRKLIPGLEDIEIATPDPSLRQLKLVIDDGLRIEADAASAGVRLLAFFVALAYHPAPPKIILLEEPETGIHPRRIADVVRLLRKITRGELGGSAAQVILTTHSPYLLDCVDLDTDQVLVFRREPDGSRTAEPVDAEGLKVFLDEFMLGEIWYNEGEEGLVARHR